MPVTFQSLSSLSLGVMSRIILYSFLSLTLVEYTFYNNIDLKSQMNS